MKRYMIFGIGMLVGVGVAGYQIISSYSKTIEQSRSSDYIGYTQTGSTIQAHVVYYSPTPFALADFQAMLIWGWYQYVDGKHLSKWNLLTYAWVALPQHLTTTANTNYLWDTNEQKVAKYIQNFIILNNDLLQENNLPTATSTLPKVDLIDRFKLSCLDSSLLVVPDFCEYNLEQFAQQAYKYDLSYDFGGLERLYKQISKDDTRDNLCQSIVQYEMISWNPDGRFTSLLQWCSARYLQTHQAIIKRYDTTKQLQTMLQSTLDSEPLRNQFKLVSAMQLIQSQIDAGKIDIKFLDSYHTFVSEYLKSPTIDQFTVDLIYKYHNQYLINGIIGLQKVVNLDTVQDLQNMVDRFDTLNNGDNLNTIGLRYRVSPDVVLDTDYATLHPVLGTVSGTGIIWSNWSWVDVGIINTLIGSIDTTIQQGLNTWTILPTETTWSQVAITPTITETTWNTSTTGSGTTIPIPPSEDNWELDLNTYQPSQTTVYTPWDSESKIKTTISDRFLNHLGIKPDTIITKTGRHFVERSYKGFVFSAFVNKENDRRLSPIYVQIDEVRTVIPWFELYLMDYDRYSQVKFLKNPESYVRQATQ